MSKLYEIAIQSIKPEHAQALPQARARFLEALRAQPSMERDWTFESFFTMPTPDEHKVLVGITRWRSRQDFQDASDALIPTEAAKAALSMVQMKAFMQARTVDGEGFDLEAQLADQGQVLEVAVRRPKEGVSEERFQATRQGFFAQVAAQPGYLFDRELIDDAGQRVVLIGWASKEDFLAALEKLQEREEMGECFSLIEVQAYQATQLA